MCLSSMHLRDHYGYLHAFGFLVITKIPMSGEEEAGETFYQLISRNTVSRYISMQKYLTGNWHEFVHFSVSKNRFF